MMLVPLTAVEAGAAAPAIRFSRIQYDSPGTDTGSNKSLTAEWARVTNHGSKTRTLTGWPVRDPQGHVYRFPRFRLKPGRGRAVYPAQLRACEWVLVEEWVDAALLEPA